MSEKKKTVKVKVDAEKPIGFKKKVAIARKIRQLLKKELPNMNESAIRYVTYDIFTVMRQMYRD